MSKGIGSLVVAIFVVLVIGTSVSAQEIPGAARVASNEPATLSFERAVQLAIDNNLATLRAHERQNEARGQQQQSLAPLLPNVSGVAYQANLTENLVALGFQPGTIPGFTNTFLGPFKNFDARLMMRQSIFNLSAIRNYQAGTAAVHVAELQETLAREQVASGILAVLMAQWFIEDPPYIRSQRPGRIDYVGFGLMAVGLATLQLVLDKGQEDDWFSSAFIFRSLLIAVVALVAFVVWELRVREPIVNLRVLANRNFAVGTALIFAMGVVLYGTSALLPLFLQTLLGYPAAQSGFGG